MSAKEKISRLEEMLARVQRRAGEPRAISQVSPKATTGAMPMSAPTPAMAASHASQASHAPATPATPRVSEPPAAAFPSERPAAAIPSERPADRFPSAPPPELEITHANARPSSIPPETTNESIAGEYDAGSDGEVDVEVSSEVVDIDVDVDIDETGMPLESGAQPVADHASLPDDTGLGDGAMEATMTGADAPVHEPMPEETAAPQTPANEIEEPAPSSSPRRVASEKPEAFEEESAPRHTPPPESGKQVAAAPSTPPARKTSAPPPSLEGHTLIGGWREPGLGGPIIGQPGQTGPHGVRVPAPGQAPPAQPGAQGSAGAMPPEPITATRASVPPRVSDRPLSAEVTKAELPGTGAGAKVAAFEGAMPSFKPSTFGELLDASLSL